MSEAICAVTRCCSANYLKPILIVSACFPCYVLSLDRCAVWKVQYGADVWPARSGEEEEFHSTKQRLLVSAKRLGLHFAPLSSGFQALQGFSTARGYQRWGTTGCWQQHLARERKRRERCAGALRTRSAGAAG